MFSHWTGHNFFENISIVGRFLLHFTGKHSYDILIRLLSKHWQKEFCKRLNIISGLLASDLEFDKIPEQSGHIGSPLLMGTICDGTKLSLLKTLAPCHAPSVEHTYKLYTLGMFAPSKNHEPFWQAAVQMKASTFPLFLMLQVAEPCLGGASTGHFNTRKGSANP